MQMKLTATLNGKVLHSDVFEIAKDGDYERAHKAVMDEARKVLYPSPAWDVAVSTEHVKTTP